MKKRKKIGMICLEIFLWLLTAVVFIPYLLALVTSIKSTGEAGLFQLTWPSKVLIIENYKMVFEKGRILQGMFNSITITSISLVLILFVTSLFSFYVTRVKTKISSFLYYFLVMGTALPITLATTYTLLKNISLLNKKTGVILIFISIMVPYITSIYTSYVRSVPVEMDEAAIIDGCGPYGMFFKVIFPLLKPANFTCAILTFMAVWNDSQIVLFFLNNSDDWTMPLNAYRFYSYWRADWNYIMGSVVLTTLPVFIIYLFGQRYIVEGMVSGAVKG